MSTPRTLVFSDVDETLIQGKSMFEFLAFYLGERCGTAGLRRARRVRDGLLDQAAAGVSREETNRAYYRALAGEPVGAVADAGRRWVAGRRGGPAFFHAGVYSALRRHRAAGAHLALVSGSFRAVVDPIAELVGAHHVLCTEPAERDGVYTGDLVGMPVVGSGKQDRVRELLRAYPLVRPADCFGYGDHISDLPMLTEVGHAVIVGGDRALHDLLPGAAAISI